MNSKNLISTYDEIFASYPDVEISEHIKKLIELDYFLPYNSTFYCITNTVNKSFEYVSKNFTACTGLSRDRMLEEGMEYFWSLMHPDDVNLWIQSLQELMQFTMNELTDEDRKKMSYSWNYRIRSQNGAYLNIVQNTTPLQFDKNDKPVIGLAHYTILDSEIDIDICASAKILNEGNEYKTLYFKNMSNQLLLNAISKREKDIVRLVITKNTSEDIAKKLNLSKHTVDTHRRNILRKLNIKSTSELLSYFKNNPFLI